MSTIGLDYIPSGAIMIYGGATAPDSWFLCDGSAVSRATYANLFFIIGTTFGIGDGSTTFNLPDLRSKLPKGKGGAANLGDTGGATTHTHGVGSIAPSSHAGTAVADHAAHTHSVTSNVTGTITPAGSIAWPANPPTMSGIAGTLTPAGTIAWPVNPPTFAGTPGTTGQASTGATALGATASTLTLKTHTHTFTPAGTISYPVNVPIFTGTASQSITVTNQGTIAYPANVPIFTGTASQSVSMVNNAVTSGNPSATLTHSVTQPSDHTMSGTSASSSNESPYLVINYIIKN